MDRVTAQGYAFDALLWLIKHKQFLQDFLILSGAKTDHLKGRAKEPEFLCFVLDFFMTSDDLIIKFSKDLNIAPEHLQRARSVLSGGDLHHWT
tara:strand:- start:314 stop:592 length:279 start_codon:yes stop_codon:yes gene_type:complete